MPRETGEKKSMTNETLASTWKPDANQLDVKIGDSGMSELITRWCRFRCWLGLHEYRYLGLIPHTKRGDFVCLRCGEHYVV
jgi:hypothetical protein